MKNMLSAFKQFAERTVNSRSSTGRVKIGLIDCCSLNSLVTGDDFKSTNGANCCCKIVAERRIASSGSIAPLVCKFHEEWLCREIRYCYNIKELS